MIHSQVTGLCLPEALNGARMRRTPRRYQQGCVRKDKGKWVGKYYDVDGVQRTKTLGEAKQITKSEAQNRLAEILRPINIKTIEKPSQTVADFLRFVFLPVKKASGTWRAMTAATAERLVERQIIPYLGDFTFGQLQPAHLREYLQGRAKAGLGKQQLQHLRSFLRAVIQMAVAEGNLDRDISLGLSAPKALKPQAPKLTVGLQEYRRAWETLGQRERLMFDLIMFCGLRQSEAFGLQCGDLCDAGLRIQRSVYRGITNDPKTQKSRRIVGIPTAVRAAMRDWIQRLPANGSTDWLFPSETIVTSVWPNNVLTDVLKPKLKPLGLEWVTFAVLRRSHATLHKIFNTDPVLVAHQQGHDLGTHMDIYVQPDPEALEREASKLYARFEEVQAPKGIEG